MEIDYNPRSKECIEKAKTITTEFKGTTVQGMDVFLATLVSNYDLILLFLTQCTSNAEELMRSAYIYCENIKRVKKKRLAWSREASKIIKMARAEAEKDGEAMIGVEHIFRACLLHGSSVADFLSISSIDPVEFCEAFVEFSKEMTTDEMADGFATLPSLSTDQLQTNHIDQYCDHINTRIRRNNFQFYGRMDEIHAAMTALCRKQKSNVLFVGDAGVGKTALVEGLALAMENPPQDTDIAFVKMDIFELKLTDMIAGAMYRGEFERRLTATLDEVKALPTKAVLFIDEFHMVVGAGDNTGSMDVANILKPALANGEISCIAATTFAEYKKYIEKDGALSRRFEVIQVKEPSVRETQDILVNCKSSYEAFHGVRFSEGAIKLLVESADENVPYRRFPDKAFDLLDEAGTFFKLQQCKRPDDLSDMESKLKKYADKENISEREQKTFERILHRFQKGMEEWTQSLMEDQPRISKVKIATFIKKKFKLKKDKRNLYDVLREEVIGQDSPLLEFCTAFAMSQYRKSKSRPKLSVLISGPFGVGKTTLVKSFAKEQPLGLSGLEVFDMSHYVDGTSSNKMLGSSAGYVGYDKGGVLTEKLKKNPNSILLFRDIDKAHPSVKDIISQILVDGSLMDNIGEKIDCSRCIIFLTTSKINKQSAGFGEQETVSLAKSAVPEDILGSVDKHLVFNVLDTKSMCEIVSRHIHQSPLTVELDSKVPELIVSQSLTDGGVRPSLAKTEELAIGPAFSFLVKHGYKPETRISMKVLDKSISINKI
jgi:ATP-dependent Clp protease ATP-binding subunit ClpC